MNDIDQVFEYGSFKLTTYWSGRTRGMKADVDIKVYIKDKLVDETSIQIGISTPPDSERVLISALNFSLMQSCGVDADFFSYRKNNKLLKYVETIVTSTSVELLEGVMSIPKIYDYLKD